MGLIAIAWIVPHLWWLLTVTETLLSAQDISPLDGFTAERVLRVWMHDNIFFRFTWVPWTLPVLAILALRMKSQRALLVGWLVAAFAWIAVTSVDLPDVSIPRVHLPAFLLVLPLAGIGFEVLRRRRLLQAGLAVVTLIWAAAFAPVVLESTNGDAEEELIRALERELDGVEQGACIARLGLDDLPPAGRTPRYFPEYLFPKQALLPLKDTASGRVPCDKGTWVVLGTRCYMRDPELGNASQQGERLNACERIRRDFELEPVLELNVPHRAESTLPMYPDIDELELGLYRLMTLR